MAKSLKIVVYTRFLECSQYTLDKYWRDIFYSCACNKFPKGSRYDNTKETLHVRYEIGNNKFNNQIFNVPNNLLSEELYNILTHAFKNLLNLRSDNDLKLNRLKLEEIRKQCDINLDCDWKKLKPRSLKNNIIMNFVIEKSQEYNLSQSHTLKLYKLILLAFQIKQLSSDDVNYKKGKIIDIKGLTFYEENNETYFMIKNNTNSQRAIAKPIAKRSNVEKSLDKWAKDYKNTCNFI